METRAYKRIATNIHVSFCCCTINYYSGTATNVSENGMFISTYMCFPLNSDFDILILSNKEMLKVPVIIRWLRKSSELYDGVGVEVKNSAKEYFEFIDDISLVA
jgi:hypothetical protein